jgi:hypothetical protein
MSCKFMREASLLPLIRNYWAGLPFIMQLIELHEYYSFLLLIPAPLRSTSLPRLRWFMFNVGSCLNRGELCLRLLYELCSSHEHCLARGGATFILIRSGLFSYPEKYNPLIQFFIQPFFCYTGLIL